jgi:hypothetical protein
MLNWHITGTRSGSLPFMTCPIRSLEVMALRT